jgi:hypothetical protein
MQGNGGEHPCYHVTDLPEYIQLAYATSLELPLKELQAQLKPASKPRQKVARPYLRKLKTALTGYTLIAPDQASGRWKKI